MTYLAIHSSANIIQKMIEFTKEGPQSFGDWILLLLVMYGFYAIFAFVDFYIFNMKISTTILKTLKMALSILKKEDAVGVLVKISKHKSWKKHPEEVLYDILYESIPYNNNLIENFEESVKNNLKKNETKSYIAEKFAKKISKYEKDFKKNKEKIFEKAFHILYITKQSSF